MDGYRLYFEETCRKKTPTEIGWRDPINQVIAAIWTLIAIAAIVCILSGGKALARDNGQYENVSPEQREWVKSLKNKNGYPCCDQADGHDVPWEGGPDGYRVLIEGNWHPVPASADLTDRPNRFGISRVWYVFENGKPKIMCFIVGVGG